MDRIGIIGGGAWGTALAQTAAQAGRRPIIWAHEPEVVDDINARHENRLFLPGVSLAPTLSATASLGEVGQTDLILLVTPAQHTRRIAGALAEAAAGAPLPPVVICAKGLERDSHALMSTAVSEATSGARVAVLSGPSFAADVARGLPTAVTLAADDATLGRTIADALGHRGFRIYWSDDIVGAQIGGAVKNVLAIAAGIVVGRQLGASAHAALVTRGFAELQRLGLALGATPETLGGLSGLGDLMLTCGDRQSRNMSLGYALGQGEPLADILGGRRSVSEGVHTASAVTEMAAAHGIEMPICEAVARIVAGDVDLDATIAALMARPQRAEAG